MSQKTKIAKPISNASKAIAQIQRKKNVEAKNAQESRSKMNFLGSLNGGTVQAKLKIAAPDTMHEVEADRMADKVMRMPLGQIEQAQHQQKAVQRKCAECEMEEKKQEKPVVQKKSLQFSGAGERPVQRKTTSTGYAQKSSGKNTSGIKSLRSSDTTLQMRSTLSRKEEDEDKIQRYSNTDRGRGPPQSDFSSKLNQSKGGGQPLDSKTNSFMSSRFGADFSNVRIHTGSQASQMSNDIQAKAFTHQNHVYFNKGQYKPNTSEGKTLLAHELTHTIQQGAVGSGVQRKCTAPTCSDEDAPVQTKLKIGAPNDKYEQEADRVAEKIIRMPVGPAPPLGRGIAPVEATSVSGGKEENLEALSNLDRAIALARNEQGLVKSALRDGDGNRYGWERLLEYFEIGTGSVNSHTKDIIKASGRDLLTKDPQWKLTAWCSIFSFWAYRKAGIDLREWKSGSLPKNLKPIPYNVMPVPGDLAYREKHNHFAIVTNVTPSGNSFTVDTINGNTSNANNTLSGGEVQEKFGESKEKWTEGREKGKGGGGFLRIVDANKTGGNTANTPQIQTQSISKLQQPALVGLQRKSWDKEEEYNSYLPAQPNVQRKCANCEDQETVQRMPESTSLRGPPSNQISADNSGKIQRGFWDDPLGTVGNAISGAASAIGDSLEAGITWVKDKLATMAAKMPGYKLFTVVIAKDPITGRTVDRSARNFLNAGLDTIPDVGDYKQRLIKDGTFEDAVTWLDGQIKDLNFSVEDIIADFARFIRGLSLSDVTSPTAALDRGIKIFKPYVDKIITFAKNVALKFLEIVKNAALTALVDWIKTKTTLYPLLTLILGQDPVTGATIEKNGTNILKAIILLQADGQKQLTKMEENGSLQKGAVWVDESIAAVVKIVGDLRGAFTSLWTDFEISDLLEPTKTFVKIYEKFSTPVIEIKDFVLRVGSKILEIVRDIVINELLTYVKKETKWYPLITVVLGEDPISGQQVERNGMNLIKGFVSLHPEGEQQLKQMEESGSLQKAATWVDTSIERVLKIITGLRTGFTSLWTTFKVTDLLYPVDTFKTIYNLFSTPVSEMVSFALEVATMILKFIKDALVKRLVAFAKTIPGYTLVTVILGKDVFSEEVVERSGENIIRGFMELVPGGAEKFAELKESGAIAEALAWIEGAIVELDLTWEMLSGLFTRAWKDFSLKDLAKPLETFQRVMDLFGEPIGRLIAFVGKVVIKLIEIALRIMGFPFELIGSIISRAQTAYEEIKNDPVGFLKNMLKAVKQGFVQFFGNILTHLLNGVGEWLFGQLGDTGITIPTDFSFKSILGMVFEVLGITKEKIFEKLKKKVGPEKWAKIEGMIDTAMGVWSFVKDIMERGPIVIWEKIQEKLTGLWDMVISAARNWIMTKIIEQVTVKLLSFLDPTGIMAVVNSFIAFFKAIQSAIEYMIPMLEMLNSFLGGVIQIAQGNIKPAADLLEQTMAKGMPILIGFLANQVGLGRIGEKIREVIESIQEKVDEGIQWMIDKAWELGAKLLEAGAGLLGGGDKDKPLSPTEKAEQLKAGEKFLLEKENKYDSDNDSDLSREQAEKVALDTKTKFNVFKEITPIPENEKWTYNYISRSAFKGSKKTENEAPYRIDTGSVGTLVTDITLKSVENGVKPIKPKVENIPPTGYVASVRRVFESKDKKPAEIANMYLTQAFATQAEAAGRMAMVVGGNGIDDLAGKNRKTTLDLGGFMGFPFAVIGFLWRPRWVSGQKGVSDNQVRTEYGQANTAKKALFDAEERKAFTQTVIPYGLINGKIAASPEAGKFTKLLKDQDYINEVFLQTADSDAINLNVQDQIPGDAQAVDVSGVISGLFTRYDELLERYKGEFGETPLMASGGYSFELKSNGGDAKPEELAKVLSSQLDNEVRSAMANYNPQAVYFPEPNTIIKVAGDRQIVLDTSSFGKGAKEGESILKTVLQQDPRAKLAFDKKAKLITDSVRFKVTVGKGDSARELTISSRLTVGGYVNLSAQEIEAIFNIDQSHAKRSVWVDQMAKGYDIEPYYQELGLDKNLVESNRIGQKGSLGELADLSFPNLVLGYKPDRAVLKGFTQPAISDDIRKGVVGTPSDPDSEELYYMYKTGTAGNIVSVANDTGQAIKTFLLNNFYPSQPKLKVGSPSDPLEQEADQMADVVMRSPEPEEEVMRKPKSNGQEDEKVQRKCAKCAEEETAQRKLKPAARIARGVYRKSTATESKGGNAPNSFEAQISANKGQGKPLDTKTQSFMENRFGADFSNVKIHTGAKATSLNNSIQAKAFTTGKDIYFNQGEYNPTSHSGKKLLAHELTHTIQQGAAGESVQRTSAGKDFEVDGILNPKAQDPDTVYFDRKSAVLVKDQEDRIVEFMTRNLNSPELFLYGYGPDEEEAKEKDDLIKERLKAVEGKLKTLTKKSTVIHSEPRPKRSKKSYQYRKFRAVEMSAAEIVPGAEKGNSETRDCNQTEINTIDAIKTKAIGNIDNGLTKLDAYQKKPADHGGIEAILDRNFKSHDPKIVKKIIAILKLIKRDLGKISDHKKRRCGSLDHRVCAAAHAFALSEKAVTFCPKYFADPELLQQRILVHEIGHFLKMDLDDRAYSHNRVFKFLSTKEALQNTDSFAILINELNGIVNKDTPNMLVDPSTDTIQNCGVNLAVVEEALAWAQRWNGYAESGLRQTYGSWNNFKFMQGHITPLFGGINRYSIAGLVDRARLLKAEYKKNFDFSCFTDADAVCQKKELIGNKTKTEFAICPGFFKLSKEKQIVEIGAAVTRLVASIPEKHREAYAKIGKAYKVHFFSDP